MSKGKMKGTTQPVTRQWPAPSWAGPGASRHEQLVDGERLAWLQAGSGLPLILFHGYAGDAGWWQRNLAALAQSRSVYALDLPGFGGSRLTHSYSFERSIAVLARWIELNGLAPADLVGHSMGGELAVMLAARHPDLVRRLVLLAPAGLPFDTRALGLMTRALRSRLEADPRFTPIVAGGALRAGPRLLWHAFRQIRTSDIRPDLPRLRAPTLIVWGVKDRLLPPRNAAAIAAAIPGAEVRVVPGGHDLFFNQARTVNALIQSFLDRPDPASADATGAAPAAAKEGHDPARLPALRRPPSQGQGA